MFVRPNQFRNANADVQIFYGSGTVAGQKSWNKPVGVSHVYMLLIGGGGDGDATAVGGSSGAVTVWYGAAKNVPDSLIVNPSSGDSVNTTVTARFSNSIALPTALLTATGGSPTAAGTAMTANQFTASGFFQSVAGHNGQAGAITPSATTFLSGGCAANSPAVANYGYSANYEGSFWMQPIIVGVGGASAGTGVGGIGCGGSLFSKGGRGMILIASL